MPLQPQTLYLPSDLLRNLENLNADMIEQGVSQSERLIKLNNIARKQLNILSDNAGIKRIESIDNKKLIN